MDRLQLLAVLDQVRSGALTSEDAAARIGELPGVTLAAAAAAVGARGEHEMELDHHRERRTGVPEMVYGASKTAAQIVTALRGLAHLGHGAIATRVDADKAAVVRAELPTVVFHDVARVLAMPATAGRTPVPTAPIAIVCAGTSDLSVADEAAVIAELLGAPVIRVTDVGVAGLHRLLARVDDIRRAEVVIAVAGMEAALPSVIAGLVDRPVIAVPTSIGYGVSVGGLVALGALLAACAPGISVVNIDNGVGAAVAAVRIARIAARAGSGTA